MARILVVDDDANLPRQIATYLTAHEHEVELAQDGSTARALLQTKEYDAVILDWELPDVAGPQLCEEYRSRGGMAAVLMLTGKAQLTDKEAGFEAGVDDYLTKPFSPKELIARINALLRRGAALTAHVRTAEQSMEAGLAGTASSALDGYEILGVLGEGAMGLVYKARHKLMNRIVAIKILQPHLVSREKLLARFSLEAMAISALSHPNIISIFDHGMTSNGLPFIVMEYLEGLSLEEVLEKEDHIPVERAVRIFKQSCDALSHAHNKGIIHRDLKPTNLMLTIDHNGNELLKLVDFGIAKVLNDPDQQSQQLTRAGEVFGSPLYMSPEQTRGRPLDQRSDIFSLGCMLYHAVTGIKVFLGEDPLDTMYKRTFEKPIPPSRSRPELNLPESLDIVILTTLAVDPAHRYPSMEVLKAELDLISLG